MTVQMNLDGTKTAAIPEEKANDFPWVLQNRIFRIFNVISEYGEDNFVISFSGGKDSMVLHYLIDMALPNNRIPRVYVDTGIELRSVRDFVFSLRETDDRITVIKPTLPIKKTLEEYGYPFKSKNHSELVNRYQTRGITTKVRKYLGIFEEGENVWTSPVHLCPKKLKYQFTSEFHMKISDQCCIKLKEEPFRKWQKENGRPYSITGITRDEGGRRESSVCTVFSSSGKLKAFQPLVPVTKEWEEWFIEKYNIKISEIYKPPYNFPRTGCKGCPFIINLQEQLDILEEYFPAERAQCEAIWKPVYDEYRRIGYRLKKEEQMAFRDEDFGGSDD